MKGVMSTLILILALFFSGCSQTNTGFTVRPESFTSPPYVIANETTGELILPMNSSMLVSYPWTPEDGRFWRVSVTPGLFVTGDRYVPYPSDMPVEVSGNREWMVKAISSGSQTFVAYLRPRINSWNQEVLQYTIRVTVIDDTIQKVKLV